jgi:hypothetical protein
MESFRGKSSSNTGSRVIGSALLGGIGSSGSSGTFMACPSSDTSFFCQFTRIFKIIMMIVSLLAVGYIIYAFFIAKSSPRFFGGMVKIMKHLK